MSVENVSREDWTIGGLALLLVIDLLFLPWFSVPGLSFNATGSFDGWTAVIAVLVCIAIIVDLAIERLSPQTTVPSLGSGRTETRFILACVAAFFVLLKFVLHIHLSYMGFGFWAAVVLTVALVYFALQARNAGVGASRI